MTEPYNYKISPFDIADVYNKSSVASNNQLAMEANRTALEQKKKEAQRQEEFQKELMVLGAKPTLTSDDLMRFSIRYPEVGDNLRNASKQLTESQQNARLAQLQNMDALRNTPNSDPALLTRLIQSYIKAALDSGQNDYADSLLVFQLAHQKGGREAQHARAMLGVTNYALNGPEKYQAVATNQEEQQPPSTLPPPQKTQPHQSTGYLPADKPSNATEPLTDTPNYIPLPLSPPVKISPLGEQKTNTIPLVNDAMGYVEPPPPLIPTEQTTSPLDDNTPRVVNAGLSEDEMGIPSSFVRVDNSAQPQQNQTAPPPQAQIAAPSDVLSRLRAGVAGVTMYNKEQEKAVLVNEQQRKAIEDARRAQREANQDAIERIRLNTQIARLNLYTEEENRARNAQLLKATQESMDRMANRESRDVGTTMMQLLTDPTGISAAKGLEARAAGEEKEVRNAEAELKTASSTETKALVQAKINHHKQNAIDYRASAAAVREDPVGALSLLTADLAGEGSKGAEVIFKNAKIATEQLVHAGVINSGLRSAQAQIVYKKAGEDAAKAVESVTSMTIALDAMHDSRFEHPEEWNKTALGRKIETIYNDIFGISDSRGLSLTQYQYIISQKAKQLMAGPPYTDFDLQEALKSMVQGNASPEVLFKYLTALTKQTILYAAMSSAKAEWIRSVGGLGATKNPIKIAGEVVDTGTTWTAFAINKERQQRLYTVLALESGYVDANGELVANVEAAERLKQYKEQQMRAVTDIPFDERLEVTLSQVDNSENRDSDVVYSDDEAKKTSIVEFATTMYQEDDSTNFTLEGVPIYKFEIDNQSYAIKFSDFNKEKIPVINLNDTIGLWGSYEIKQTDKPITYSEYQQQQAVMAVDFANSFVGKYNAGNVIFNGIKLGQKFKDSLHEKFNSALEHGGTICKIKETGEPAFKVGTWFLPFSEISKPVVTIYHLKGDDKWEYSREAINYSDWNKKQSQQQSAPLSGGKNAR